MRQIRDIQRQEWADAGAEAVGQSFFQMYKLYGLESAIFFLRKTLHKTLPVSQINIISLSRDMTILSPVCSTNPNCSVHREVIGHRDSPRYICPNFPMTEVVIINDLSEDQEHFSLHHSSRGTCFVGQKSLLRIPFYFTDDEVYLAQFWSEQAEAFSRDDAVFLERVFAPLQHSLITEGLDFFASGQSSWRASTVPGYEQLSLCIALSDVLKKIMRVAPSNCTVLIVGETGVGKENVADALVNLSERRNGPFIKINCGAIAENLIDSALFGHERGSFTGAVYTHYGFFEQAHNGTVFLDEIGELSLAAQVKLLRFLDSHTFQKVGGSKEQAVDIRLVAATNRDLAAMVKEGTFRKDLYYRISAYPIYVPPLRERREDILPLTSYFVDSYSKELGKHMPFKLTAQSISGFYQYSWPGNIRELRNVVERAMINYVSGTDMSELRFELATETPQESCMYRPPSGWPTLEELEHSYISAVLEYTGWKMSGANSASSLLGIHYTTLRSHLRKMQKMQTDTDG